MVDDSTNTELLRHVRRRARVSSAKTGMPSSGRDGAVVQRGDQAAAGCSAYLDVTAAAMEAVIDGDGRRSGLGG